MLPTELLVADAGCDMAARISPRFAAAGWSLRALACAQDLVPQVLAASPACVLMQLAAPAAHRLGQIEALRRGGYRKPILAWSDVLDVPLIVDAIKRGADDFLHAPAGPDAVFDAVGGAVAAWAARQAGSECVPGEKFRSRVALTGREVDILRGIAAGATAKEAASKLDLSPRTVEFYRARLLTKVGARNAADLMRIVME